MKTLSRFTTPLLLIVFLAVPFQVHAQATILPATNMSMSDCQQLINLYNAATDKKSFFNAQLKDDQGKVIAEGASQNDLLGCGIKTGEITLEMVPYFITYVINFLLALSGLISVLFIIIGGYHYVIGGLTDEKDKGKKTIEHALMGMALALMAWTIVNVIMSAITG